MITEKEIKTLDERTYELSKKFRKLSPALLMKKFKINYEAAQELHLRVCLRNFYEAREWRKNVE